MHLLYLNLGCCICISSINLSSAIKNVFVIYVLFFYSNFFYISKQNTNCNLTLNITVTYNRSTKKVLTIEITKWKIIWKGFSRLERNKN